MRKTAAVLLLLMPLVAQSQLRRRAVQHPFTPAVVLPQTIVLTPAKDNTLFETADGSLSNGAGVHIFAGMTAQPMRRRALIAFDLASRIPPGSQVTRVSLKLTVSQTVTGAQPVALHALTKDWGEAASNAGEFQDGDGAQSRTGDATWLHTFFPSQRWTTRGGDFTAASDATAQPSFGEATWESTAMLARVQQWVDTPSSNFGWIVIGNESTPRTAKRFDSREVTGATKPSLTVEFIPPS